MARESTIEDFYAKISKTAVSPSKQTDSVSQAIHLCFENQASKSQRFQISDGGSLHFH